MEISDLVPIAGIVASIIGAGFVARHQIKKLEIDADKLDQRLDRQDIRLDKLTTVSEMHDQRMSILSSILSPSEMERRAREIEAIGKDIEWIRKKVELL